MATTATYIIKAVVGGETYLFQYEHCYDAWAALEQFWHEDYPETIINLPDCCTFPIDILSMLEGKVIATMPVTFNCAVFDHFFDKGWSASSHEPGQRYTLDQFAKDIAREPDTARDIIALWSGVWTTTTRTCGSTTWCATPRPTATASTCKRSGTAATGSTEARPPCRCSGASSTTTTALS